MSWCKYSSMMHVLVKWLVQQESIRKSAEMMLSAACVHACRMASRLAEHPPPIVISLFPFSILSPRTESKQKAMGELSNTKWNTGTKCGLRNYWNTEDGTGISMLLCENSCSKQEYLWWRFHWSFIYFRWPQLVIYMDHRHVIKELFH